MLDLATAPHRRYNPLSDEWVLCSPHRTLRPWQGAQEKPTPRDAPSYDPECYLCPGNERQRGARNPDYEHTFVFRNDFSALLPDSPLGSFEQGLLKAEGVQGECRVICFSPRHDMTLGELPQADVRRVIDTWVEQVEDLGRRYTWVQVFENRGQAMGASNPHPHGQLWAAATLPTLPAREDRCQLAYFEQHGRPMLLDALDQELQAGTRVVCQNDHWAVIVPFWATWPFETLLLPKAAATRMPELDDDRRDALAAVLKDAIGRYDRVFDTVFPYSMGWHGAPTDGRDHPHWTLHAHFYPPLLRSATVRKFMVGFEMLAESQRDITPEQAAERLRSV